MKTRTTLVLAAIAAGLFGFILLYESHRPDAREAALRQQYVALFDQEKIEGIVITSGEARIELRKRGSGWEMETPVRDRADPTQVAELLGRCGLLHKEATLAEGEMDKKQFKSFGVSKPSLKLKLLGPGAPPEFLFGKDAAVEGKGYLRLEGSRNVHIVANTLRDLITRPVDAFRDHRLAEVEGKHVDRVSLKIPAGEIEMTRQAGKGNHWMLTQPLKARAGETAVVDLIGSVLHTGILGFAPDGGANLNRYGLSEPRAVVRLYATSRDEPVTLEIGARDPKSGNVYARLPERNAVCLLPPRVERLLGLQPNNFRDRHLLRVDLDVVDRITLEWSGKPKRLLQRHQEAWTLREGAEGEAVPVNPAKVKALLAALQSREIRAFVSDVASDLPKYGLDEPQLRVTFSSYSSGNTAEGLAGEQPIVTAAFGSVEGDRVYARAENEPYVVAMDAAVLGDLKADPATWRSLTLFDFEPGKIATLEAGAASLLRRDGKWAVASEGKSGNGPGTVDAIHAESMANTLSGLTAMRREGGALPGGQTGSITFKTADGATHRLLLGPAVPEGGCYGAIEGEPGIFLLSAPDESALRLPLLRK